MWQSWFRNRQVFLQSSTFKITGLRPGLDSAGHLCRGAWRGPAPQGESRVHLLCVTGEGEAGLGWRQTQAGLPDSREVRAASGLGLHRLHAGPARGWKGPGDSNTWGWRSPSSIHLRESPLLWQPSPWPHPSHIASRTAHGPQQQARALTVREPRRSSRPQTGRWREYRANTENTRIPTGE